ncbi:MAG: hypothetical protein KAH64_02465 [Nitrosomonadaceae bacterium]|nr:hypothetical protein [Nitrosomonadaceae bacterium]
MDSKDIIARFRAVKSSRTTVQSIWDWIERYIAPYRGDFFKDDATSDSVEWRRPWVYDATGVMAAQNLASSLNSRLTSASTRWFGLRFRSESMNEDKEAVEWLQESTKRCFDALQDSNFNTEINETYQDLVCFGTSVLMEEENTDDGDDSKLNFNSVPIKECYFEEDHNGGVLNFYRHIRWTVGQIKDFFGDQPIPEYILDEIYEPAADPDKKYDIIFCIFRCLSVELNPNAGVLAAKKRPYGFKYVLLNTGDVIGDEGGYYEKPAFVARWRKTSASMWGNSPAMIALSDVMTLNRTIELNLTAVEKSLDPPTLTTSRGLIGDLDLTAGGLTTVRDINELQPFTTNARFDVTYQEMNRLRENIESYFFIPQLILPPMQGTPATATEISVRMQQLEALIGPTLGRLQTDMLDPIVSRTFRILLRAGQLPEMPDSLMKAENGEIDIEYTSPFAKTQEASNVQALEQWIAGIANFAQVQEDVLDIPDWDQAFKDLAAMRGVEAKNIKSETEIKRIRKEREEVTKTMQEGAAMQELGKGMQEMKEGGGGGQI